MNNNIIIFDDQKLFGNGPYTIVALSWQRKTIEKGFAGLDGVLSIDLGMRGRKLKQKGRLVANSATALVKQINTITSYINGKTYTLLDQNGTSYANVRMDNFNPLEPVGKASQTRCEYEIIYTQLSS